MFIDEARIYVKGGDGGAGAVSFRREKHVPRGGPDGGNGGYGGNVVFEVDEGSRTLMDFKYKRKLEAKRGGHGEGNKKNGLRGADMVLKVPPGTLIKDDDDKVLVDLKTKEQRFISVEGGHGGKGNAYFVSSTRKVPQFAQKGEPGKARWLRLELKLLADVGIVGMPNVGKSTFISVISSAKPKIADYPFTTLVPNLGVVETDDTTYVVADIPGLIEGAYEGAGLGGAFLRHIDRAGLLLHMLDVSRDDPIADFKIIEKELLLYKKDLADRLEVVILNKLDALSNGEEKLQKIEEHFKKRKIPLFAISAATKKGLKPLMHFLGTRIEQIRKKDIPTSKEKVVTYRLKSKRLSDFEVTIESKGVFRVTGKGIERLVVMTNLENIEASKYLQAQLKAIRFEQKLKKAGAKDGDLVKIASYEFYLEK